MPRHRSLALAALAVLLLAAAFAAGNVTGATTPAVVRASLAESTVVRGAPGRTLGLARITVPAGAQLALHHHPGTQIASIAKGTLTYTVQSGSVTVMRGTTDKATVVRRIRAGQTGPLAAGDWIVEQPSTIHRAANRGTTPVVLYIATLFPHGSPPSIPN